MGHLQSLRSCNAGRQQMPLLMGFLRSLPHRPTHRPQQLRNQVQVPLVPSSLSRLRSLEMISLQQLEHLMQQPQMWAGSSIL
jgi:hypothetical protein